MNMCHMKDECKRGNIIAKTVCDVYDQSKNFKMECPYKKVN